MTLVIFLRQVLQYHTINHKTGGGQQYDEDLSDSTRQNIIYSVKTHVGSVRIIFRKLKHFFQGNIHYMNAYFGLREL